MPPITLEHITLETLPERILPFVGNMMFTITITPEVPSQSSSLKKNEICFWDESEISQMGKLSLLHSKNSSSLPL